ncbi:uncharacterized protein A1O9_05355 [Exophiala aquamarina CBS 119918]|uniref:Uncharacterized protein n=1 Tax=Exophiala aquamarina CBS 119918 TaxID=1182545 RepID=A0A072PDS0_9EURO|nr:uncharacterized protein A1O9_05355 [Exophiala aquamarina CBS 119918]KEF57438.1 hypothetical protein A1O9_05355 [Exophiala aquamarina CBS 119918]
MAEPPEIEDSEFIALCAQYLDLKFDLTQDQPEPGHDHNHDQFSSPCSNDTDQDGTRHSKHSASTAHTTPLRPSPHLVEEPDFSSLPSFLLHLQYSDMPHASKDLFAMLADHICEITSLLMPNTRLHEDSIGTLIEHSNIIIAQVQQSARQVLGQIHNIAYIKTLAPFEVHPTTIDLWCNYRQMVQLIVKQVYNLTLSNGTRVAGTFDPRL